MKNNISRLRIFAGPNGSGKTTIFDNSSVLLLVATAERGIITLSGETTPFWFEENVLEKGE